MAASEQLWTGWNIGVMAIGTMYCFIFLLQFLQANFKHSRKHAEKSKVHDSRSRFPVLAIFAGLTIAHIISWLCHFAASMTTYMKTNNNRSNQHDVANWLICVMIICHPMFFYAVWMSRLYFVFQKLLTVMELGLLITAILCVVVLRSIEQVSWIMVIAQNPSHIPVERLINCSWAFLAFDCSARILLIVIFVRKLFLVVNQSTQNQDNHGPELSKRQITFIALSRKITVLGIFSVAPMTLSRIIFVLAFVANKGILEHGDWIAFNTLQCVAVFCEILCVLMTFSFNGNMYKLFCKVCDQGITKYCFFDAVARKRLQMDAAASQLPYASHSELSPRTGAASSIDHTAPNSSEVQTPVSQPSTSPKADL